jgi:hypothetical protein
LLCPREDFETNQIFSILIVEESIT